MGQFSDAVGATKKATLYEQVQGALAAIGDGSEKEFAAALKDKSVTVGTIVRAVQEIAAINISETTVERWRKKASGGQVRE